MRSLENSVPSRGLGDLGGKESCSPDTQSMAIHYSVLEKQITACRSKSSEHQALYSFLFLFRTVLWETILQCDTVGLSQRRDRVSGPCSALHQPSNLTSPGISFSACAQGRSECHPVFSHTPDIRIEWDNKSKYFKSCWTNERHCYFHSLHQLEAGPGDTENWDTRLMHISRRNTGFLSSLS